MKQIYILKIVIAVFFCVLFVGCEKNIKTFKLTIVTVNKLGDDKSDKYPEVLQQLCYPIKATIDKDWNYAFSPINIIRLGSEERNVKIDISADERKSNIKSMNYRKNIVTKYFQDATIGDFFIEPNDSSINYDKILTEYLLGLPQGSMKFYYANESDLDSDTNTKIYNNTDSLSIAISKYLYKNPNIKHVFIVYEPIIHLKKRRTDIIDRGPKRRTDVIDRRPIIIQKEVKIKENKSVNENLTPQKIILTLNFPFGYYKGETVNGLMHGNGTLYFKQGNIISSKDPKKRFAEAGDYVSGSWFEGFLDQGKWFNKASEQKETIIIGH